MTINSNVTIPDTNQKEMQVKFTIPGDWITAPTQMIKRVDRIGTEFVELDRRCRAMITHLELLIEGIEQVQHIVPTYQILSSSTGEEEKPEFLEDLEQEEEEIKEEEEPKDETNSRV